MNALINFTCPLERLAIDFERPMPWCTGNYYLLVVSDDYSRFPFCFPWPIVYASTVIKCQEQLFTLCDVLAVCFQKMLEPLLRVNLKRICLKQE